MNDKMWVSILRGFDPSKSDGNLKKKMCIRRIMLPYTGPYSPIGTVDLCLRPPLLRGVIYQG